MIFCIFKVAYDMPVSIYLISSQMLSRELSTRFRATVSENLWGAPSLFSLKVIYNKGKYWLLLSFSERDFRCLYSLMISWYLRFKSFMSRKKGYHLCLFWFHSFGFYLLNPRNFGGFCLIFWKYSWQVFIKIFFVDNMTKFWKISWAI